MAKGKAKVNKAMKAAAARLKKGRPDAKSEAQQEASTQQSLEVSADPSQHLTATQQAVVGLSNLGNTCFFNSSVQLLLACAPLQQMLLQKEHEITKGPLGYALQQAALHADGRSSASKAGSSTYNPHSLLSAVCCHAPVFRGKQQHDAHELMRMLLDGLQSQEQRYKDLSKRGAGKGLVANGTAHSSAASSASSDDSPDSSVGPTAGPQQQTGKQAGSNSTGSNDSTNSSSDSSDSTLSTSSSSSGEGASECGDGAAANPAGLSAAADNGLEDLCQYLRKPATPTLDGLASFAAADSVSTSHADPAGTQAATDDSTGNGHTALSSGLSSRAAAAATEQPSPATNGVDTAGNSSSCGTRCKVCGCALGLDQQQQRQQPLQRKSLLPPEPPTSAGSSSVEAVFGGVLRSCITCTACGYCSISYEPFLDLSLPIPLDSPQQETMTRKGSLLSRLGQVASRSGGKKKAAAAASAATESTDAADNSSTGASASTAADASNAAEAAASAAAEAAAAAAAAASNKKVGHKEKRRLQQQAAKAAKQAAKLARLAKKQQQDEEQQQDEQQTVGNSSSTPADTVQAGRHSTASESVFDPSFEDPALFEAIPATNYYTREQQELKQSVLADRQQQQHGEQGQQQGQPEQQQQQQQEEGVPPLSSSTAAAGGPEQAAAVAAAQAAAAAGAVSPAGGSDEGGSSTGAGWTDLGAISPSPPTASVSCWGVGWSSEHTTPHKASPAPPGSSSSSNVVAPPPSSSSGFPPSSSSDAGAAPVAAAGSDGDSSSQQQQQQQPRSARVTLHRRFASLGSLTALTAGAKGGLTGLFYGRHSRQSSRDKDGGLDRLSPAASAAAAEGSSPTGGSPVSGQQQQPGQHQRPHSAGGAVSPVSPPSSATSKAAALKAFLLHRTSTPPPPRPASALAVLSEDPGGVQGGVQGGGVSAADGTTAAAAALPARNSIPEDSAVEAAAEDTLGHVMHLLQQGQQGEGQGQVEGPFAAVGAAEGLVGAEAADAAATATTAVSVQQQGPQTGATAAAAADVPNARLQRAFSDDAVVRLGSFHRLQTTSVSSSSSGGGGGGPGSSSGTAPTTAEDTAAAAAGAEPAAPAANGTLGSNGGSSSMNPFAAVQQQQQQLQDAAPAAASQQQQQGGGPVAAGLGPSQDPFAAAAVVGKGESLAVRHCLAAFFVREDVCWVCPKEKALWKERRLSAAGGNTAAAAAAGTPAAAAAPTAAAGAAAGSAAVLAAAPSAADSGEPGAAMGSVVGAVCAACSQQQQQQLGCVASAVPVGVSHQLQQLSEGDDDEDEGLVWKQVSFSDRGPEVHMVPGSVEQRGTDLAAALSGRKPFCRALSFGGASLLLTAQLGHACLDAGDSSVGDSPLGDASVGDSSTTEGVPVLRLGLKAAGEGGVVNTAAQRLLPGGRGLQLGTLRLPDVKGLGLSSDDSSCLLQHWAQLVLNCMADLLRCEGGIRGLQAMVAGGLRLLPAQGQLRQVLRPGYVDSSSLEGQWKVRGQLPGAAAGGSAGGGGNSSAGGSSAGGAAANGPLGVEAVVNADAATAANGHPQQQQQGYWEYPAGEEEGEEGHTADAADAGSLLSAAAAVAAASGSDGNAAGTLLPGVAPTAAAASNAAGVGSAAGDVADGAAANGLPGSHTAAAAEADDANAAAGGEEVFEMDDEDGAGSDMCEGVQQQAQGATNATSPRNPHLQLADAAVSNNSSSHNSSSSLFKKVPLSPAAAAATAAGPLQQQGQQQQAPLHTSQPVDIVQQRQQQQGSGAMPSGGSPAAAGGSLTRTPVGTPNSLRRSSLRRRSSSCSRTAHKSYRLFHPPPVLLLHLKRFQHDGRGRLTKLDTPVRFDFELNLQPFMASEAAAAAAGDGSSGSSAAAGSSGSTQQQQQQQALMYDLVGLVVHMGTMRGGHYVAYVKRVHGEEQQQQRDSKAAAAGASSSSSGSSSRAQWYYVSDTSVRPVKVSEVAAAQAYMLLYVRRPPTSS